MGSLAELLRTFDLPLVFPEINSLQTAVRHVAHEYLDEAEDYGYSPDICGYVKADVATQLRSAAAADGQDPQPGDRRATRTPATPTSSGPRSGSACTACPIVTLDVPGSRADGTPDRARRPRLRERPALRRGPDPRADPAARAGHRACASTSTACARTCARERHDARLEARPRAQSQPAGAVQRAVRRHDLPRRRERLPRRTPRAPPTSTSWSRRWSTRARTASARSTDEAVPPDLRRRALLPDLPALHASSSRELGGHVRQLDLPLVRLGRLEPRLRMSDSARPARGTRRGAADRRRATRWTACSSRPRRSLTMAGTTRPTASCLPPDQELPHRLHRAWPTAGARSWRPADIPSLFIESDMMDRRVVSEAQLKNRVDAFFEGWRVAAARRPIRAVARDGARPWRTQRAWTSGPRRPRR